MSTTNYQKVDEELTTTRNLNDEVNFDRSTTEKYASAMEDIGNEGRCYTHCSGDGNDNGSLISSCSDNIATEYNSLPPTTIVIGSADIENENVKAKILSDAKLTPTQIDKELQELTDVNSKQEDQSIIFNEDFQPDLDEPTQLALSERWSPLGANYDDMMSPTPELLSPESEMEFLSSDSQDRHDIQLCNDDDVVELKRIRTMEDEQELLTSSLMALTSHFAHVQLRVRQIVEAPSKERDQLLKDLEEFAFRGIPEPITSAAIVNSTTKPGSSTSPSPVQDANVRRQYELIEHLKAQLSELENIAYESGAPVLPQHMLLEKQKIIIDELKSKLNLKVEQHDLPELSPEELKNHVDNAIGEFVGPLRMKDQLVAQLKTQIADLERFIVFLQCDTVDSKINILSGGNEKLHEAYNSYAAKKKSKKTSPTAATASDNIDEPASSSVSLSNENATQQNSARESLNSKAHGLMDKASILMHMFATTHLGMKAEHFQKNSLKKTSKGNHWGDLRAQLEVDIQEVASLAATLSFDREKLAKIKNSLKKTSRHNVSTTPITTQNGSLTTVPPRRLQRPSDSQNYEMKPYVVSSDTDDEVDVYDCYNWEKPSRRTLHSALYRDDTIATISRELTAAVRKNFAITLQQLMQHGLRVEVESAASTLMIPFIRCLNPSPVFSADHRDTNRDRNYTASLATSAASVYSADCANEDNSRSGFFFGSDNNRQMHAWELILEYYYLKHGDEYNNTPVRKLSESFNLEIVDSNAITPKQNLLSTIGAIIAMHRPYKRSYNAHFKAFICAGLNNHQLVEWLNLILSCTDLVDMYYMPNSYVARTGFRDSLRSIDTLTKYDFDLPVDLAVRHFRNL